MGTRLRALLLDRETTGLSPRAEALLYAADRAAHVDSVIRPALDRGAVVVTDRYIDSSVAYQGAGRVLPAAEIRELSDWATDGLLPRLTVLLDIDPSVGLHRFSEPADRIESESLEFHRRVREGFLEIALRRPDDYLVVDATLPVDEVHALVRERLAGLLPTPVPRPQAVPAVGSMSVFDDLVGQDDVIAQLEQAVRGRARRARPRLHPRVVVHRAARLWPLGGGASVRRSAAVPRRRLRCTATRA